MHEMVFNSLSFISFLTFYIFESSFFCPCQSASSTLILQVQAIDRDITSKNGKVCSYAITEDGIPFSIDTNGIISLQEELPQNYPNRTVFHLRATDCNDKVSDDDAVVRVKIKDKPSATLKSAPIHKANCKPGLSLFILGKHLWAKGVLAHPSPIISDF